MTTNLAKSSDDQIYNFYPDQPVESPEESTHFWKILIVDDDDGVHEITKIILKYFKFEGSGLILLSAHNEEQAIQLLNLHPDIAIVLLDVVMDTEQSGLKLVKYIREILFNRLIRIVLRTGQPGQAPEKQIVVNYDINDYKLKTELTADKLFVTVVSLLRSYKDLLSLDSHSDTLRRTVSATSNLFRQRTLSDFIQCIPNEYNAILANSTNSDVANYSGLILTQENDNYWIIAANGIFEPYLGKTLDGLLTDKTFSLIKKSQYMKKKKIFQENEFAACLTNSQEESLLFYIVLDRPFTDWDISLLELFSSSVKSAYNTLYLADEVDKTHREIIFTLGEVAEARSKETGNHVRRVSEYSKLLAQKIGLPEYDVELIGLASPVHDIGKISIPDYILNKPGKLTPEEFQIIKTHAMIGYEMLKNSQRPILQAAANIALMHHEKWDGTGYPSALAGEDISIYGRIVALADVFDALDSDRIYKKAWPLEDILNHLRTERSRHFDPQLIDAFLAHLPDFLAIRNQLRTMEV